MKRVLSLFLLAASLFTANAFARSDFDVLAGYLESNYGSKRTYIPFLGFANFVMKCVRPAGASSLKLAVFERVDSLRHPATEELDETVRSHGWKPFIRVLSNEKRERVQIYARPATRDHELLLVTFERDEAVMVQVRINPERLSRWVNNPVIMGRSRGRWEGD